MGEVDIEKLNEIYRHLILFCQENYIDYNFTVDHGSYETAIEFYDYRNIDSSLIQTSVHHPPISQNWSRNSKIKCPDILDYNNRIIIEYEEETGNKKLGAKLANKGHGHPGDLSNKKDTEKFLLYKEGNFRVFRIWESNENWKHDVDSFLNSCTEQDNQ